METAVSALLRGETPQVLVQSGLAATGSPVFNARGQAIADARRKAEIYARAAGVTLGAPISISEDGAPGPVFRGKMVAAMAPTPVAQGEETLAVTVNVTWAIKPAGQ